MSYVHMQWQNEMGKGKIDFPNCNDRAHIGACMQSKYNCTVAEPIYYTCWSPAYVLMNAGRQKEEEEEGGREERQPNHWPDTFFVKAIMVRSWCFCCCFILHVTRSFLSYFFRYINDLELLLNDLQNRVVYGKSKAEDGYSTPADAVRAAIVSLMVLCTNMITHKRPLDGWGEKSGHRDAHAKFSPVQISAGTQPQFTSLRNSTTFCFVTFHSVKSLSIEGALKTVLAEQAQHRK